MSSSEHGHPGARQSGNTRFQCLETKEWYLAPNLKYKLCVRVSAMRQKLESKGNVRILIKHTVELLSILVEPVYTAAIC